MSIGERILSEIIKQQMFVIATPDPEVSHVFVWSSGAAEQLEALVNEAYLEQVGAIGPFENPESQKPLEPAETWLQERANWMIAIKLLEAERDALRAEVERLKAKNVKDRELSARVLMGDDHDVTLAERVVATALLAQNASEENDQLRAEVERLKGK